jgi:hypothetical protein
MNDSSSNIKNQLEISKTRLAKAFGRLEAAIDHALTHKSMATPLTEVNAQVHQLKEEVLLLRKKNHDIKTASRMALEEVDGSIITLIEMIGSKNGNN